MKAGMVFFAIFIGMFYLIGFGMLGYGLWSAHRSVRAGDWPTTDGALNKIILKEKVDDGTTYEVQVEYSYTVAGSAYTGSRVAFGYSGSSGLKAHNQIYMKLKHAKTIAVRYDPLDPSTSTLSFGVHRSITFVLAFAITWLVFVFGFTVLWWLMSRSDSVLVQNLSVQ